MRVNAWDAIYSHVLGALVARHDYPSTAELVSACDLAARVADMGMRRREQHLKDYFGSEYRGGRPKKTKSAGKAKDGAK